MLRCPHPFPKIDINKQINDINDIKSSDIEVKGYIHFNQINYLT